MSPTRPDRFSRQRLLPAIGDEGQRRLSAARVLIVGCGATGTFLANHLARAGVGMLRIVDRDWVEWNNLQRQLLFTEDDARHQMPKAVAAADRLRSIDSDVQIDEIVDDVRAANIERMMEGIDLVLDGTDNFETRYIVNDACVKHSVPWVYSGVVSTYGMIMPVRPGSGPCLRCVFENPPPAGSAATCDTAGVLGPAVGVVASLAATEALRSLVDPENANGGTMIHVDVWEGTWHKFRIERKDDCPCCTGRQFPFLEVERGAIVTSLCGRNAVQVNLPEPATLDLEAIAERLKGLGEVTRNRFLLKARIGEHTLTLFPDGRAVVEGTDDPVVARSVYARYVGA
jgi:molybdopterin-synthase adenylyltransferase